MPRDTHRQATRARTIACGIHCSAWQEESTATHTWQTHRAEHLQLDRSSLRRGPIQDTPPPKQPHAGPDPRRKQQQPQYPHPPKCQAPSAQANHTEKRPTPQARRIHAGTSAIASTWGNAGGACEAGEGSQGHHHGTPTGKQGPPPHESYKALPVWGHKIKQVHRAVQATAQARIRSLGVPLDVVRPTAPMRAGGSGAPHVAPTSGEFHVEAGASLSLVPQSSIHSICRCGCDCDAESGVSWLSLVAR